MAYSSKPLWQYVLIYAVVGGLIYLLIYYLFFANTSAGTLGY